MVSIREEMYVDPLEKCLKLTKIRIDQQILVALPISCFMRICSPFVELLLMAIHTRLR
jgi:hypothetical protein